MKGKETRRTMTQAFMKKERVRRGRKKNPWQREKVITPPSLEAVQPLVARKEVPPRLRGMRSTLPKGERKRLLVGKWERQSSWERERVF